MPSPDATLVDSLLEAVSRHAEGFALRLVLEDGSFKDLDRRAFLDMALRVAGWCREKGLAPGGRAVLCLENSPAWGAAYFGILLAGGVVVPVDAQSTPEDAAYFLEKTRARLVFASREDLFASCRADDCILARSLDEALAHEPLAEGAIYRGAPGDPAALLFTSGTTGRPKAVTLTHANLLANVESIKATGLLLPTDNFLAVLPLHHAYPCMVNLLVPLLAGARSTFLETLKPEAILSVLKSARISLLVLTPQYVGIFLRRILKRFEGLPLGLGRGLARLLAMTAGMRPDPLGFVRRGVLRAVGPDFRFFLTGGAKCDPEVIEGMAALGLPVIEGYGLSETAPVVSLNRPDSGKPGSVGTPLKGVEARIDLPDAEGYGDILVRGANVMLGYFEDPEATALALRDGWFHTGDQGRMDPDGALYVRGRERDIIVLPSGKKFPAEEVEAHYLQAPSVGEICVLQGEGGALTAVVTPDREFFRATDAPDVRHNIRWDMEMVSKTLPPYKRVGAFTVVPGELPKTRLGKLKRHLVEKMLSEAATAGPVQAEAWTGLGPSGEKALAAIREVSGMASVAASSHLELDLGLDSLRKLELLTLLEDVLGRTIAEERFQRLATAGEVVALARELAGETPLDVAPDSAGGAAGNGSRSPDVRSGVREDWRAPGDASGLNLDAPLPPELAARVRTRFGPAARLATSAVGSLVDAAARLGFSLTVRGAENIPEGAALICPNHASYLDAFMVFAATPPRLRMRLYFLGLARYLDAWLVRRLAAVFRLIPVDAGRMSETMRLSARALRGGGLLCVFPEGARTVSGELQEFRQGPVVLSGACSVPVVPVAIAGTFEAWPVRGKLKLGKVTVRFGKPFMPGNPEEVRLAVGELLRQP
ncbi:AMP-binding protein [Fundidesulfovibrio terrae]|uniref:AMP-binding protein n=1 Tax=Fundidesulfovibrio terrae TaxID=2922866 RepID=UPI001FAFFDA2|nr:AMP-binding protein [Fundidesulfovibrio terrae]